MKLDKVWSNALGIIVVFVAVLLLGNAFRFLSRTVIRVGGIAVLAALIYMVYRLIREKAG